MLFSQLATVKPMNLYTWVGEVDQLICLAIFIMNAESRPFQGKGIAFPVDLLGQSIFKLKSRNFFIILWNFDRQNITDIFTRNLRAIVKKRWSWFKSERFKYEISSLIGCHGRNWTSGFFIGIKSQSSISWDIFETDLNKMIT